MSSALLSATMLAGTVGCGDQGGGVAAPSGASSVPATPDPGGRMTEGLSTPLVLVRGGGIGGVRDQLEVRPDGTATVTTKGRAPVTRQLGEGELAAIVTALRTADLTEQKPPSTPAQPDVDRFTYTITAEGTTVTTSETTATPPVRRLLAALEPLFSAPAPTP